MADKTLNVRIEHRYDTEANWKSKNPVLLQGEIGFINDGRYKVGNGTSKWNDLPYAYDNYLLKKTTHREWTTNIKCATWSRLCYVGYKVNVTGSTFILNVSATRNSVVYNDTLVIKVHHSQKALITKISGCNYSTVAYRVVSDSSGNCYVELNDSANKATNATIQSVRCTFTDIDAGSLTTYNAFTDGTTVPNNFIVSAILTTNKNSLQGNLTWDEVTGKPSTFAPSSHAHTISQVTNLQSALDGKSNTNHTHSQYLPLNGGTMTGQIKRSAGGNWVADRDYAAVFNTLSGGDSYQPVVGQKTAVGSWTIGSLASNESLVFNYCTDANYKTGNNTSKPIYLPAQAGTIITSATIGAQSVKYATSAGSATSASKLTTNAGSAIQPIYFSNGVPVSCTYTLGKSVPSNAVFTDTNTWRPVENVLNSTSTSNSLSAAQGKVLNDLTFQKRSSIDASTDWNTLKNIGCYKVQITTWGDASTKHGPNNYSANIYSFGLLLVFRATDSDTENRTIQIYIPHKDDNAVSSIILTRMLNGSTWNSWHPLTRGTRWTDLLDKPSTYAPSPHTHDDRYYTESEINSKLATKSNNGHTHDDRYYTESEINSKLSGKSNTNHTHDLSTMINALSTASATPTDNDYYIAQYAGGGNTTTSYYRRSHSALWNYIKSKSDSVYQPKGSYAAASHSHDGSYYTKTEMNTKLGAKADVNLANLNGIKANRNTSSAIAPDISSIASSPFSRDLWHDHFAFLNCHTIDSNQVSTNGTTWTNDSTNLKTLFQEKESQSTLVLSSSIKSRRFVLKCNDFPYSSIQWIELGVSYSNPFSNFTVLVEKSLDKSSWTKTAEATISGNSIPYFVANNSPDNVKYIRFTLTKTTNITTGTVYLTCIKGLSNRKGDQGLGIEYEQPYDWDYNRNIYPYTNNTQNLGNESKKWANVYATTFNGALSGNASSANKLATARTISLTGSVTGSGSFDGSGNLAITTSTNHTHSYVTDINNNAHTTFAYSKAGMNYADYTWLAAWNGNELRAINKSQFATAGHTHAYLPLSGGTLTGNINYTAKGSSYIGNGEQDNAEGPGGKLNNLVISSWYGVSFTTSCTGQTYSNKTAVGIDCRNGIVKAQRFDGAFNGNATTATALTSSAGSTTQPIYFSGGKPVACSYTLAKSVPADAKFTDTNTWRGIQNNLTSTATDQSLSAAQGKWLKENKLGTVNANGYWGMAKPDGTTADWIRTTSNGILPYQSGGSGNGHSKLGTSSWYFSEAYIDTIYGKLSGNASTATKLQTARTVSGGTDITVNFSYDGSGNSSASIGYYSCYASVGSTNNYPYHRFAKIDSVTGSYVDKTMTVYISQDFNGGAFGIARISLRTNNVSNKELSSAEVKWLIRNGISADAIQIGLYNVAGATYADAFIKLQNGYYSTVIRAIANGARGGIGRTWTLVNSTEANSTTSSDYKTSSECYVNIATAGTKLHNRAYTNTISGSDAGTASSANSLTTARSINGTNFNGSGNITTANWGTTRTVTIGNSGKSVNGSGNVSWSLSEIGAAAASHTHNYAGSSSAGGSATSAVKLDTTTAGSATQPVYFKDGKPTACTYTLGKSVPSDAKFTDTNTTYPFYNKTINKSFSTQFRTQTKGNANNGDFIATIRNDTASVDNSPQFGSGIAFGRADTHGYIYYNYNSAAMYVGAGNADKLNWIKQVSFTDHTHNYLPLSGGTLTGELKLTSRQITFTSAPATDTDYLGYIGTGLGNHVHQSGILFKLDDLLFYGNPTFAGEANFSSPINVNGAIRMIDYSSEAAEDVNKRRPITSVPGDGLRVGWTKSKTHSNGKKQFCVNGQWGTEDSNGNPTNKGSWTTGYILIDSTSDVRLKKNIKNTDIAALPIINQMKIRQFDWKETGIHQQLGLVADELDKFDPLLTVGGGYEADGSMYVKQIDRLLLTEYAIKGIQEQQDEIVELQKENKELKQKVSEIDTLKEELAQLKELIISK